MRIPNQGSYKYFINHLSFRNETQGGSPGSKQLERNQSNMFSMTRTTNLNGTLVDPSIKAKMMADAKLEKE